MRGWKMFRGMLQVQQLLYFLLRLPLLANFLLVAPLIINLAFFGFFNHSKSYFTLKLRKQTNKV